MAYLDDRRNLKMFGVTSKPKKTYSIPKKSAKKIEQEKKEKELRGDDDTELQKWFKARIKYSMKGVCEETGLRTETKIYQYAIMSCCHILPKRLCKSVMCHPLNFIELAPDIHTKFDAISWEEKEKWGCWQVIQERLIMMYPDLDESEKRHFPESVKKLIDNLNPFQ